jgi:hypothetical protein
MQPPRAVLEEHQGIEAFAEHGAVWKTSAAMMLRAWLVRNCSQVGPVRRGAGSMSAVLRISHTVDAAILCPSPASSSWILL